MKQIRITLRKGDAVAVCTHMYRTTDGPMESRWSGDREMFRLPHGSLPGCHASLERLERVVAYQARLAGATYAIEDLGGEAERWWDEVILSPREES
jgi:hypothetical protein